MNLTKTQTYVIIRPVNEISDLYWSKITGERGMFYGN